MTDAGDFRWLPLLQVARGLGPLRERVVFVGGSVTGLFVTDPGAPSPRPTDDVDLVVELATKAAYYTFAHELRGLGFAECTEEDAPSCRGAGDPPASVDLEDFLTIVDGRAELVAEVAASDPAVRNYLAAAVRGLLDTPALIDALPGHLPGDAASQARLPLLLARLRAVAAFGAS